MAITQAKSKRSETGSRYRTYRKKKQHELGRQPAFTKIAENRVRKIRTIGNNSKLKVLNADTANVYDKKTKKSKKVKIKQVIESAANRNYVRRNIMTKGTVIETDAGNARITSRPGQDGVLNAVLIEGATPKAAKK